MTCRPSGMATGIVEWAARDPDRAAFVDLARTLTVGELDRSVGALAARLLDGRPSTADTDASWLPIVVDRSLESAVAMHGAIRAGLALAPIESHLPPEVVAEMFARLGHPARAVVIRPEYADRLPSGVEAIAAVGHETAGSATPQPVALDAPGIVFFTSGTTGRPKGVISPWATFEARIKNATRDGPARDDGSWRESYVQPFGFAPASRALAMPCVGRTVCVANPNTVSVDELLDWLDAQQVDSVSFPPSLSTAILRVTDGRSRLPSVSLFRSGTEASDWALVAPVRTLVGPHVTIRCGYASSEGGSVTRFVIGPEDPIGTGRIPMGRLEPGAEVRLEPLDDDPSITQLVVARPRAIGYLGDPELTARRFMVDEDGVRWWKSGDLVEVDDDGVYHHRGRADELVKIRGVFVAPSRSEEALRTIDGIAAAAVIPMTMAAGNTLLVAHVQVDDDALTPERVSEQLRALLPEHLMPAILVRHDALPRTERQKVDRRALQDAPLVRWRSTPVRGDGFETRWWCLAEVRRIVGLEDIAIDDDLFAVGLDSLGALELCAALADAGYRDVDPSRLVETRTIRRLCDSLELALPTRTSTVVALNGSGTRAPIFGLPGGGGTAVTFRFLAQALGSDRPLLVVEPRGMHRPGPPDRTVDGLAEHACLEIEARLGADDPCVVLGYSAAGPVAYEAAQRVHASGRRVALILLDSAPVMSTRDDFDDGEPRGRTQFPDALTTWAKQRAAKLARWWLMRHPGPPRYRRRRYDAFRRIMGNAVRSYRPTPATFPVAVIHLEQNDLAERTASFASDLSVFVVQGTHHGILEFPEVEKTSAAIAEFADAAFARTRR